MSSSKIPFVFRQPSPERYPELYHQKQVAAADHSPSFSTSPSSSSPTSSCAVAQLRQNVIDRTTAGFNLRVRKYGLGGATLARDGGLDSWIRSNCCAIQQRALHDAEAKKQAKLEAEAVQWYHLDPPTTASSAQPCSRMSDAVGHAREPTATTIHASSSVTSRGSPPTRKQQNQQQQSAVSNSLISRDITGGDGYGDDAIHNHKYKLQRSLSRSRTVTTVTTTTIISPTANRSFSPPRPFSAPATANVAPTTTRANPHQRFLCSNGPFGPVDDEIGADEKDDNEEEDNPHYDQQIEKLFMSRSSRASNNINKNGGYTTSPKRSKASAGAVGSSSPLATSPLHLRLHLQYHGQPAATASPRTTTAAATTTAISSAASQSSRNRPSSARVLQKLHQERIKHQIDNSVSDDDPFGTSEYNWKTHLQNHLRGGNVTDDKNSDRKIRHEHREQQQQQQHQRIHYAKNEETKQHANQRIHATMRPTSALVERTVSHIF